MSSNSPARVLRVDLGALEHGANPARGAPEFTGAEATLARWGGSALGLACLAEHARRSSADALVIAVGEAVRDGLPTAARAAVLARAPLSGLFAEGHVGGELGARLVATTDALVLTGACTRPGAVLVLAEDGTPELHARPQLRGTSAADAARALEAELGPCAVLAIGPAGEQRLPFANLAAGHAPPSFVGRGGLGAVFGGLGLKALCVRARPARPKPSAEANALLARLRASPRLAARAAGGTLELFDAWAARGELAPELGHALADEARARADTRHGCRGCPTPCGWVFERSDGERQGARFGASQALGVALGLATLDDALFLLARCDQLGADAKEVGALLTLVCTAQERGRLAGASARGERAGLARRIDELVADTRAPGRAGVARLAEELGLAAEVPTSRGQAVRPEASLAALLGQCVASGGADPMRSFPFLLESTEPARLAALLAPLPVPPAALDPRRPDAKGRLVVWHENLIAAVDLTGFCAFSAAGLLADGLCTLDELAEWILPEELRETSDREWREESPGRRLLAAGANLVLARRALNERYAAQAGRREDPDRPAFARAALDAPGMLDEYRALRGLDADGTLGPEARAALGTTRVLALGRLDEHVHEPAPEPTLAAPASRALGTVSLRSSGALAEALGRELALELALPASLATVLRAAASRSVAADARLFAGERLVPAVYRDGRRLAAEDEVRAEDVLELVTAISGG